MSNLWQFRVRKRAPPRGCPVCAGVANTLPHLLLCSAALHNEIPLGGRVEGKAILLPWVRKGEQAWCSLLLAGSADLLVHSSFQYKCATSTGDFPLLLRKPSSDGGTHWYYGNTAMRVTSLTFWHVWL